MARIPLLEPHEMTPEQRAFHDSVVTGPRGAIVGPLRAALHSPDLAARWSHFGEYLRYDTSLPARLSELAIVVTGRHWTSQIEWWIHAKAGIDAGLDPAAVEAIRLGNAPVFDKAEDAEVYEFARFLQSSGQVPLPLYQAIQDRWGVLGSVELGAVIGYYTMVSMTLNLHELPLPEGVVAPLSPLGADSHVGGLLPAVRSDGQVWSWMGSDETTISERRTG